MNNYNVSRMISVIQGSILSHFLAERHLSYEWKLIFISILGSVNAVLTGIQRVRRYKLCEACQQLRLPNVNLTSERKDFLKKGCETKYQAKNDRTKDTLPFTMYVMFVIMQSSSTSTPVLGKANLRCLICRELGCFHPLQPTGRLHHLLCGFC